MGCENRERNIFKALIDSILDEDKQELKRLMILILASNQLNDEFHEHLNKADSDERSFVCRNCPELFE